MPPIDLTTALAGLLSDADLRGLLAHDPQAVARQLHLREADHAALKQIDLVQLERQAQALVAKRYHEVAQVIPITMRGLGADSRMLFRRYAAGLWPSGHRRHLEDALAFCNWLAYTHSGAVDRAERTRLQFRLSRWRFLAEWCGRPRPGMLVLVRLRGRVHEWRIPR